MDNYIHNSLTQVLISLTKLNVGEKYRVRGISLHIKYDSGVIVIWPNFSANGNNYNPYNIYKIEK